MEDLTRSQFFDEVERAARSFDRRFDGRRGQAPSDRRSACPARQGWREVRRLATALSGRRGRGAALSEARRTLARFLASR